MSGKYFRDPVHGEIFVPEELLPIVDHPYFQRLRRVGQLGLAPLVYPSAVHTRFSHSLGVFHVASHATSSISTLAYALVHDIGHGPFSHLTEYALGRNGKYFNHEERMKDLLPDLLAGTILTPKDVLSSPENALIFGGVGADRLDYLRRDSYFAGIAVGEIAWDRIVRNVSVSGDRLLVRYKVLPNVEHVFVSRFILGDALYFHKTVLIANEMFVRAIGELLNHYSTKEIVAMDDFALVSAFRDTENEWWSLIERRELFDLAFRESDRESALERYEKLVAKYGDENVLFGERSSWHKPPEVVMEDGRPVEEVSPLIASLTDADRLRHYYFVAVRR